MGSCESQVAITITIRCEKDINSLKINKNDTVKQIISKYIEKFLHLKYDASGCTLKLKEKTFNQAEKLESYINDINNNCVFDLILRKVTKECGFTDIDNNNDNIVKESIDFNKKKEMEIDINFFKINKNKFNENESKELKGLLKLCLLKEIAITNDYKYIKNLPEKIRKIMSILKIGKKDYKNVQEGILEILKSKKGSNIFTFAKYVDGLISQNDINIYLISKLSNSKKDILYIYNCLGKYIEYIKIFEKEFEKAKKESIFEFSIISTAIIERENIDNFEKNRQKCPNRIDRVLFHGTSYDSISKILPDMFYRANCIQNGEGVYFTEDLDSCWIYGSEEGYKNKDPITGNRNLNIPKVGEYFSFIASAIYYNKNGFRRVIDNSYTPQKNEINFALAEMEGLKTVKDDSQIDKRKFYGTEFVINYLDQICPILGFKLKRDEYCIIWRDTNFSIKPVYNNKFDKTFKDHLDKLMEKINQKAKFNIYPCSTSEEALKLIKRKKYNKIILISNIGIDYGGRTFVEEARKILKNNIIVLFSAYSINHLKWVKDFPNALFSNDPKFYEQYLDCFYDKTPDKTKIAIKELKGKIENHYQVKFNFDNHFLFYPYTEKTDIKKYKDILF